ncbi:MAG: ribonuclease HII [Candidatus Aenigmatarchaeota archaeon]
MIIAGIDENGRGCIIGPLVITAYFIDEEKINELEKIGVKDSKKLSEYKREKLFEKLIEIGSYIQEIISAKDLNYLMLKKKMNLNEIELLGISKLINKSNAKIYFIDAPFNPKKFKEKLMLLLKKDVEIIADHKMDEKNLVVAAASIIGKVIRDREIEKIKREINFDFGSGYVSDEKTRKFLEKVFQEKKDYDFIRKAWITYEEESKKIRLKKIIDFI